MGQSQKLDLALRGLFTSPNLLSGLPPGGLTIAKNVVLNAKNLAESRRGQSQYGSPLSAKANKLFNYSSSLITHYSNKMAYDSGLGVWIDYSGNYVAPSVTNKMRSLEALRNFYFTTDQGIYKLDALASTPRPAGVVRALSGNYTLVNTPGFLENDTAVAYQLVWGYVDANNNLVLGAPSARVVVVNDTVSDYDVTLTFTIPETITTEYFYQIYRSTASATAADEPPTELQLVIQGNPSSAEITAKSFTLIDQTPYSLMRASLYTNPSQEGEANSNFPPPLSADMDIFKNCAFYVNTKAKQSLSIALISVDSPSLGYVVDATVGTHTNLILDTISDTSLLRVGMRAVGTGIPVNATIVSIDSATQVTLSAATTATASVSVEFQDRFSVVSVDPSTAFSSVNYWAGTTQNIATNTFLADVSSTPGPNINATAINLVELINLSASNTNIYAFYVSALEDLPGQIRLEERTIGGDNFTVNSTSGVSFSPPLPSSTPLQLITAISAAYPTVVTSFAAHGLTTGETIMINFSDSTPSINGTQVVTVLSPTTFSLPIDVTVAGTLGYFISPGIGLSQNDAHQNRAYVSKASQVESVPIYRYFDIGSANFPIQRVIALRDGIFFFKQDGFYRISGETFESFTVTLLDNTVVLKVPESAVAFNNQVFCFTSQGICAVTDTGVKIISVPIEAELLELSSDQFINFSEVSFAVAYESARLYMFFTVTEEDDTYPTQAFIYNSLTDSWTRWIMDRTCGIVNTAVNKLFMSGITGQIYRERKSYTSRDYADEEYTVTVNSIDSSTALTLASATNIEPGMTLVKNNRDLLIDTVVGNVITVLSTSGLTTGAGIVYTPIENEIEWAPMDVENPGLLKQFSEVTLFFKDAAFEEIDVKFSNNIAESFEVVPVRNLGSQGFGQLPFGMFPWGGNFGAPAVLRTYVPKELQRCSWMTLNLKINEAFTNLSLQGASVIFNPMSSRLK